MGGAAAGGRGRAVPGAADLADVVGPRLLWRLRQGLRRAARAGALPHLHPGGRADTATPLSVQNGYLRADDNPFNGGKGRQGNRGCTTATGPDRWAPTPAGAYHNGYMKDLLIESHLLC